MSSCCNRCQLRVRSCTCRFDASPAQTASFIIHTKTKTDLATEECNCWHCPRSTRSRGYASVGCPSVCLSICPIRPPHAAVAGLLLRARRPGDIDRLRHAVGPAVSSSFAAARRAAVNAGSATLSADVGGWPQTCYLYLYRGTSQNLFH